MEKFLKERLALAAMARMTGVSERWLQMSVNQNYDALPQAIAVMPKKVGKLTLQCDEIWSFVCVQGKPSNGSGLPWTHTPVKLWAWAWATAVARVQKPCGSPSHPSIASVQYSKLHTGKPMSKCYRVGQTHTFLNN